VEKDGYCSCRCCIGRSDGRSSVGFFDKVVGIRYSTCVWSRTTHRQEQTNILCTMETFMAKDRKEEIHPKVNGSIAVDS
jgi:hypothetical protein